MAYQARDEVKFSDGSTAQKVAPVTAAGAPVEPAREDGNLAKVAAGTDYVVAAAKQVSVTNSSQSLAALYGASLPSGVIAIGLVPEDAAGKIRFNPAGAASATTSPLWPTQGVARMPLSTAAVGTIQFIRDSGESANVAATLLLLTARN
jgi:hypothetical protein